MSSGNRKVFFPSPLVLCPDCKAHSSTSSGFSCQSSHFSGSMCVLPHQFMTQMCSFCPRCIPGFRWSLFLNASSSRYHDTSFFDWMNFFDLTNFLDWMNFFDWLNFFDLLSCLQTAIKKLTFPFRSSFYRFGCVWLPRFWSTLFESNLKISDKRMLW